MLDVPRGLVARLSLLYGPSRSRTARLLRPRDGRPARRHAAGVLHGRIPHAARLRHRRRVLVRLAESETLGTIHLGGPERLSRFELMSRAAAALGIDPTLVRPNRRADVPFAEPRPADVSLDSSRFNRLFNDLACPQVEIRPGFPSLIHRRPAISTSFPSRHYPGKPCKPNSSSSLAIL